MNKKIILSSLVLISSLIAGVSCSNVDTSSLKIIAPTGAPSVAFYKEATNTNFETNSVPKNILANMTEASDYDLVVLPTDTGITAIRNNNAPYKIAATITFGNFYLASTGNDDNETMDEGDSIVLFNKDQTPDKIFHYIYGTKYDASITYVTAVSDAAATLKNGYIGTDTTKIADYVLIAQPALFAALKDTTSITYGKAKEYANLQDLFKEKSEGKEITQASIFVKNSSDKTKVDAFLTNLKTNINNGISNPSLIKEAIDLLDETTAKIKFGVTSTVIKAVTSQNNALGLGYKNAKENKTNIDNYLNALGMEVTNEEIYY